MYQALYRKWRPRTFDDVVGQEQVTETLKNQIITGRLSHAYLFIGTRGTGKTSCAKILARAVNCENPVNGNPCNKCKSCMGIEDGSIMDVVELDAASNNGVDNVRALRDEAIFSPAIVKKRVYIVDEVHMLSTSAFNALLKILEEPPEHLMFILATTELHKVPATILSRCQRHSFRRVDPDSMARRISYVAENEGLSLEPDAATLLARLGDGSMRDGLSLLDQCQGSETITVASVLSSMGLAGNLRIAELLSCISNGKTEDALNLFGALWREGKSPSTLLTELSSLLRDTLMTKVAPKGGRELLSGAYDDKTLNSFSKTITSEAIITAIDSIMSCVGSLRDGRDPKVSAELCIIGLCEPELGDSLDSLRTRVASLEKAISSGVTVFNDKKSAPIDKTETNPVSQPVVIKEEKKEDYKPEPEPDDDPPFEMPVSEKAQEPVIEVPVEKVYEEPIKASDPSPTSTKQKESGIVSDNPWDEILEELLKSMPVFYRVHLKDAVGEIKDNHLTISVDTGFKKTQLETQQAQDMIRAAVTKIIGRPLPFKIAEAVISDSGGNNKLSDLTKFSNVKFE